MAWQSKVNRDDLHPGLVNVLDLVFKKLEAAGKPFVAYSGLRTFAEQDELYAKGRDKDGKVVGAIVTKAKGGQSMHNYGLAVDSAPFKGPGNTPYWPEPGTPGGEVWAAVEDALLEASQEIDETAWDGIDYEWGGRWKFRDLPHIQVRTTLGELEAGLYPYCRDLEWLVRAHTTFLYNTSWIKRRVQYLLNMQSYPCGMVDGNIGTRTKESLMQFQKDQKLDTAGVINKQTVERLVRLHQTAMSLPRGSLPSGLTA